MARKIALLVGVDDYGAGLNSLRCPTNGAAAMRSVLKNPDIGGFDEVVTLFNPGVGEMRSRISEVFVKLKKRDLVLFYFTGHGLKDMTGDFYLTTSQTELFSNGRPNAGTAVEAHFLKRELAGCLAGRKVVILDCCFGAAFASGFISMSSDRVDIEAQLGGKGWCILTASTSSKYALEQKGKSLSVYTQYLVEGLKTGGAAPDGQDFISAQNLHEYVKAQIEVAAPAMEPTIFNGQQGYNIVIASVQLDNEQRYRKQVQTKIRKGTIGPAGFAVLAQWQRRLGISNARAKAIEDEILRPYRDRQKHIALYTKALEAEKRAAYPLDEVAVRDLKDLQRLLSLRDEDIQKVEAYLLNRKGLNRKDKSARPVKASSNWLEDETAQQSETKQSAILEMNIVEQESSTDAAQKTRRHRQIQWVEDDKNELCETSIRTRKAAPKITRCSSKNQLREDLQSKTQKSQNALGRAERDKPRVGSNRVEIEPCEVAQNQFDQIEQFQFETVSVNRNGDVVQRSWYKSVTFTQRIGKQVSMTLVRIPGGKFLMGAAREEIEANANEYPQKEQSVADFWIGQCTVTQAQWKAVMGSGASLSSVGSNATAGECEQSTSAMGCLSKRDSEECSQPVSNVFWTDAVAFCHKLSALTGRDYRLPSGAQWEYACRAGTTTPFYFGETITPELANYNGHYRYGKGHKGQYRAQTTAVGSFAPNAFGLYDMHGNVWEWCLEGWHPFDPTRSDNDNLRLLANQKKSLRGGSWFYLPTNCRSAYRLTYPFHNRTDDIGFRVVCLSV